MDKLKSIIKRYRVFILLLLANIFIIFINPELGKKSLQISWKNTMEMLAIIPPIFLLLGLLDVWVKKETMVKFMGDKSGLIGILLAFILGSAAAGPLYGAFPVASVLLKKGSKLSNVMIMIGAWSTTKIPLLLFEASSMGLKFTILRFVLNLFGIAIIAYTTERVLTNDEKSLIYSNALARE